MKRSRLNQPPFSLFSFQDIITSVTGVIMLLTLLLALELTTRTVVSPPSTAQDIAEEFQQAIASAESRLLEQRVELAALSAQDADIGRFTERSADAELNAVTEEIALLRDKIAEFRKQAQDLEDALATLQTEWANRTTDIDQLEQLTEEKLAVEAELTELQNSHRVFYSDSDESGRQVVLVELLESDILVAEAGQRKAPLRFTGGSNKRSFVQWASGQPSTRFRFVFIVHPGTTRLFQELRDDLRDQGHTTGFDLLPRQIVAVDIERGAR